VTWCCGLPDMSASSIGRPRPELLRVHAMVSIRLTTANTLSQYHNESVLKKYQDRLKVGTLKESAKL
jgi:hypothetical protein